MSTVTPTVLREQSSNFYKVTLAARGYVSTLPGIFVNENVNKVGVIA